MRHFAFILFTMIPALCPASVVQEAYLKAQHNNPRIEFGAAVAVDGDVCVVGARLDINMGKGISPAELITDEDSILDCGGVYVYRRVEGNWLQEAYLKPDFYSILIQFGFSVDISGDTIVVGAPFDGDKFARLDTPAIPVNGGAAFVFVRKNGVWEQQARLTPKELDEYDLFGSSVSISGESIVVGARGESGEGGLEPDPENNDAMRSGAAYVFRRNNDRWEEEAYLKASNAGFDDSFGFCTDISGDVVIVGAPTEASSGRGINADGSDNLAAFSGAAYIFERAAGVWSETTFLKASNADGGDGFGSSVSVSGDRAVVGAWREGSSSATINEGEMNNGLSSAGAVYVFQQSDNGWIQEAYLKASNPNFVDRLGVSVSICGSTVIAGAYLEDGASAEINGDQSSNAMSGSGAAYVFSEIGGHWRQEHYIKPSNNGYQDWFGYSVAVSGNVIVVGALGEDGGATGVNGNDDNSKEDSGAAYIFYEDQPMPLLKLSEDGDQILISWPLTASRWTLERSETLGSWTKVDIEGIATVQDGEISVVIQRNTSPGYFRLRAP